MQRFKVQTSSGVEYVEAEQIGDKENMFVFTSGDKTVAMFSKSFVQFVVPADSEK